MHLVLVFVAHTVGSCPFYLAVSHSLWADKKVPPGSETCSPGKFYQDFWKVPFLANQREKKSISLLACCACCHSIQCDAANPNDDLTMQKGNAVLGGYGGFQPGSHAIFWDLLFPLGDSTELFISKISSQMQLHKK